MSNSANSLRVSSSSSGTPPLWALVVCAVGPTAVRLAVVDVTIGVVSLLGCLTLLLFFDFYELRDGSVVDSCRSKTNTLPVLSRMFHVQHLPRRRLGRSPSSSTNKETQALPGTSNRLKKRISLLVSRTIPGKISTTTLQTVALHP